jgi:hypothetical protein
VERKKMEFIPLKVNKLTYFRASRLVSEPGKNTELMWYSISYLIDFYYTGLS